MIEHLRPDLERIAGGASQPVAAKTSVVSLEEFVAVDEPGAAALVGDADGALIAEGSDVMVYGDGGAGKTTLLFDLAFHLATGQAWLGIPITRAMNVLILENEGPRPLLRQKLRRKFDAWSGPSVEGRIRVFERPWGEFTFADEAWRQKLAADVKQAEIDVLIAGPLTRLGMDSAGTLQETAAFMRLVGDVRRQSGRPLTDIIAHHENRAGTVSGAWEGAGDTLLHVQGAGNGHTIVVVQKARWASAWHRKTLKLAWTDGDGFELEGGRDYVAEVRALLSERPWRTVKEIMATPEDGGIGAGEKAVRDVLDGHAEVFEMRTGEDAKALGRTVKAKVFALRSGANAVGAVSAFQGGAEGYCATAPPLKGAVAPSAPPSNPLGTASAPQRSTSLDGWSDDELQALIDGGRER